MRDQHGLHEGFDGHAAVKMPSERNFGFTVGSILLLIGTLRWFWFEHQGPVTLAFIGIGALLVVLAAVAPTTLRTPNRLWMKLGLLLASIVNPIVMGVIFFLLFAPIAFFMRMRGRDVLRLRPDRSNFSTWVERIPPGPTPESASNQF